MKSNIGKLIEESGITKRHIAKKMKVNENTIRNWENTESWPTLNKAVELADILKCSVEDLYERK